MLIHFSHYFLLLALDTNIRKKVAIFEHFDHKHDTQDIGIVAFVKDYHVKSPWKHFPQVHSEAVSLSLQCYMSLSGI